MANVCSVVLEFLRKGPPHNQLLSPLTDYLGVCGNNGAATVHVPYEHEDFLPKLRELRYAGRTEGHTTDRQMVINKTAQKMSEILAAVPGFISELCTSTNENSGVTHLSLVLSAAELSLLPFELARVPPGCPGGEGNWLLLQTLAPVCLTRQVRSVSNKAVQWPRSPKILFIAAAPLGMTIPIRQHTQALLQAILPWIPPFDANKPGDLQEKVKDILTIVPNATIEDIESLCSKDVYTHVHVLAHGMEDKTQPGSPYGVAFASRRGKDKIDIVSGKRLATALRPLRQTRQDSGERRPAVVTVASCDSGHVNDIVHNNGASFAHELHQSGVPLVIASQFPLSFPGSIYMTEVMYQKLLWGEDPRIALHQLRGKLYALHASDTHDWASLVAYAALPDDLEEQLIDVQYARAHDAIDAAMKHVDRVVDGMKDDKVSPAQGLEPLLRRVDQAADRVPIDGGYETEGLGILASTEKRKAQALYRASCTMNSGEKQIVDYRQQCLEALGKSLQYYTQAFTDNMSNSQTIVRKKRSAHWAIVQYLSLRAVFGEPFRAEYWDSATISVDLDISFGDRETQAYAHSSAVELNLLLLAYDEKDVPQSQNISRDEAWKKALYHAEKLLEISGPGSFAVYATRRQLERYVDWWGTFEFEEMLDKCGRRRKPNWKEEGGLINLAAAMFSRLPRSERWM